MDANQTSRAYELRDELARHCLPRTGRDPNRKFAWMNSVCILFLIIGVAGAKPGAIQLQAPPPLPAETVPIFVEPPTPPPQPPQQLQPEQSKEEAKPEALQVVVAMPDSPAVAFSVPTMANALAPGGVTTTPPANPMQPVETFRNQPLSIKAGGTDRPMDYPAYFQNRGEHGSVTVEFTVNQAGLVTDMKLTHSTGYSDLDDYVLKQIKKRWVVGTTGAYRTTINFLLP